MNNPFSILETIMKLFKKLRKEIKEKYNRVLPFGDYFSDRWEKAKYLGFGEETSIYDSSIVIGDVKVGKNTWIGPFTVLDGSGGLIIGDYCSISAGVQIYTHDSVLWAVTGGHSEYIHEETCIGNNCYIGPNVIIAKGVHLGDCCIVGANSFVNQSFPDNSKIAGNPARIV
jgi:acetyltransferase-like isoleucine patch superfamily enzyme